MIKDIWRIITAWEEYEKDVINARHDFMLHNNKEKYCEDIMAFLRKYQIM